MCKRMQGAADAGADHRYGEMEPVGTCSFLRYFHKVSDVAFGDNPARKVSSYCYPHKRLLGSATISREVF